ncbi:SDR family NAD(P)-dependent oxidoreductase [Sphaerimonospora thailandensis]|uniref:Short-chain dehydrogenase n=1 Tax=Sphaerimonospora thailandensis TaxID=795644 RepID=A0A8J3REL8_9ACTN|nr:SDR family NAD(P)-dependent oxidoreductase [Sphaerimonospora thailandensis]GIH72417.1 short-chain dehydrogenase [Sphaerimonospora thailandensis]
MVDPGKYGPWAVIAGGSEGVGAAFGRLLADAGINLVLLARKPGPLERTAAELAGRGVEVRTVSVDLTDAGAMEQIAAATADLEVGLLICNAGANTNHVPFLESAPGNVQRVIDLSITSPLALCRHFGPPMRERKRGGIILVGSLAGYMGQPEISIYSGAKAFSRVFAEGLWLELREHGVAVLELVLGVTRTPAMERLGLRFDLPGLIVAEPEDVAREGLEHIEHGPLHIAGGNEELAARRNGLNRAEIIASAHQQSRQLIGQG